MGAVVGLLSVTVVLLVVSCSFSSAFDPGNFGNEGSFLFSIEFTFAELLASVACEDCGVSCWLGKDCWAVLVFSATVLFVLFSNSLGIGGGFLFGNTRFGDI